jgi:cytochrome P450
VTRYADIVTIERDPETFTSTLGAAYPLMLTGPIDTPMRASLMLNDPPHHTVLRRAAAKGFGPRVVANFEPWVREIVQEVIAGVLDKDEFDYVGEFARTIPAFVIARVLGAPKEDRRRIVDNTIALFAATQQTGPASGGSNPLEKLNAVLIDIAAYAAEIQERKRLHPEDDMFTVLSQCVDRGEITQQEFLSWMRLMMGAGFETTHTAIGHAMRMYLEDAEIRRLTDRAVAEGLTGRAVDEYVRLISPPMQMARTATRDVEVAGQQVCEGDILVLYYVSANRDETVFTEPDRFDPWRTETQTLAFGTGVHKCLGLYLAKLEIQILLEELDAADLRLRLNGQPKRGWSNFINQLNELPVARVREG